jgi:hypothetical protein
MSAGRLGSRFRRACAAAVGRAARSRSARHPCRAPRVLVRPFGERLQAFQVGRIEPGLGGAAGGDREPVAHGLRPPSNRPGPRPGVPACGPGPPDRPPRCAPPGRHGGRWRSAAAGSAGRLGSRGRWGYGVVRLRRWAAGWASVRPGPSAARRPTDRHTAGLVPGSRTRKSRSSPRPPDGADARPATRGPRRRVASPPAPAGRGSRPRPGLRRRHRYWGDPDPVQAQAHPRAHSCDRPRTAGRGCCILCSQHSVPGVLFLVCAGRHSGCGRAGHRGCGGIGHRLACWCLRRGEANRFGPGTVVTALHRLRRRLVRRQPAGLGLLGPWRPRTARRGHAGRHRRGAGASTVRDMMAQAGIHFRPRAGWRGSEGQPAAHVHPCVYKGG